MSNGTTTWTNTYNADGLRTKRTNGTTTYSYVYTGSSLLSMSVGNDTLYFNYDAAGIPLTVTWNGTAYYYATNLQGDIVGILDSTGTTVVSYTYDAWGNPISTTGTLASTLGTLNPLRYRGYVYDTETGLYYLQSRYYNPTVDRFINADIYLCAGQGFPGYNTFTYCINTPTFYKDSYGLNTGVLEWWMVGMGWLPFVDSILPVGDVIYGGGILLLGIVYLSSNETDLPLTNYDVSNVSVSSPSPKKPDDDDEDDDYYNDERNFGGRQKMGKNKGKTPRSNTAQNKQFNDATKGLSPSKQEIVHRAVSNQGEGYHEIKQVVKELFGVISSIF